MSYSIIYSTHTDNIIKLAGQIEAALPKEEIIFDGRIEAVEDFATKADVIFVGFWTTKNSCDAKIVELLSTLKNKKSLSLEHVDLEEMKSTSTLSRTMF